MSKVAVVYWSGTGNTEEMANKVAEGAKEAGADMKVTKFVRFETGEGLEKKNEDFAAEVAAQMGQ